MNLMRESAGTPCIEANVSTCLMLQKDTIATENGAAHTRLRAAYYVPSMTIAANVS
jgi:hypothetical protein